GVPNLSAFVAPVFASLVGRQHPSRQRLNALTRRTRVAIRAWALLTVPILAFDALMFAWIAPHFFPGLWHSAQLFEKSAAFNIGRGDYVAALDNGFQLLFLAVPAVGFALMAGMLAGRLARRVGAPVVRPVREHPRWAFATLAVAAALLVAFIVPGGRIGEPEIPATSAAAAPRPGFLAPAPSMAIVNGHGRAANVFALAVVGVAGVAAAPSAGQAAAPASSPVPGADAPAAVTPGGTPVAVTTTGAVPTIGGTGTAGAPSVAVTVPLPIAVAPPAPTASVGATAPVGQVGASVTAPLAANVSTPVASVGASVGSPGPSAT